jgi:hypothetical protein
MIRKQALPEGGIEEEKDEKVQRQVGAGNIGSRSRFMAVRATIDEAFTVVLSMPVLGSLTQVDAPPLRATKAVLLPKAKLNVLRVTEVYPCEVRDDMHEENTCSTRQSSD